MNKGDLVLLKPGLCTEGNYNPIFKVGVCLYYMDSCIVVDWSTYLRNVYFLDDLIIVKESPSELHRET